MISALGAAPSPFPLDFDATGDRLLLVPLAEQDFRAASFLDERILAAGPTGVWVQTVGAESFAATLGAESDFIFHIGHAGSTLLSRLLGTADRTFALREPAILRTLAPRLGEEGGDAEGSPWPARLSMTLRLLARVWRAPQRSLVKATSFVGEIAPLILALSPTARALLMFVSPQVAIATRLAGPATRAELPAAAATWLPRLHRRLGGVCWRLERLSEGEMAALGWICEICALADAASRFPDRTRWLEFDSFLADPARGLAAASGFLRGDAPVGDVASMLASGELRRYSKSPDHAYDAAARAQTIAKGARDHAAEIERGLAWLSAAGAAHPRIAEAAWAPVRALAAQR